MEKFNELYEKHLAVAKKKIDAEKVNVEDAPFAAFLNLGMNAANPKIQVIIANQFDELLDEYQNDVEFNMSPTVAKEFFKTKLIDWQQYLVKYSLIS